MAATVDLKTFLKTLPGFENFSAQHLNALAASMKVQLYPKGHTFIWQGEQGQALYVIMDGAVLLSRVDELTGFKQERELLFDRLYRDASGRSELIKKLMEKQLLPYARSFFGPFQLLLSGNGLKQEEQRLSGRISELLQGRGAGKLDGLDPLIRTVVELRALPLRRVLSLCLRGWLPLHILATGVVLALLFVHVLSVTRF